MLLEIATCIGRNSEEILNAVRALSTLEHIDAYERLIWFLMEITLTFDTCHVFENSTTAQQARDAIIAALEQFIVAGQQKAGLNIKLSL